MGAPFPHELSPTGVFNVTSTLGPFGMPERISDTDFWPPLKSLHTCPLQYESFNPTMISAESIPPAATMPYGAGTLSAIAAVELRNAPPLYAISPQPSERCSGFKVE